MSTVELTILTGKIERDHLKLFLKRIFDELFAKPSIRRSLVQPTMKKTSRMRKLNGIQLSSEQITLITKVVKEKPACRFLVFGVGNDSLYWELMNEGGQTVFIEDKQFWIDRVKRRSSNISISMVTYNSNLSDWQKFLDDPALLEMSFPDGLADQEWDVILVDAPAGYDDSCSGRMKSIYAALQLVKKTGDIFVHDCDRKIEALYCDQLLKPENMQVELKATDAGYLRHYRFDHN